MSLFLLCLWGVGIGNVSAQQTQETYVKWKFVDWLAVMPENGDVVVIVDRATGLALSNDKEDKDPDAVAVELNYDKDRILGEVPEKVQWTFSGTPGSFQFAVGDNKLYADSKGLKVGSDTNSNDVFEYGQVEDVSYLSITIGEKEYFAGVEKSMFSNSWKLKEVKDGKPDDVVKDTRFAIFKKVDDAQKVIKLSFPYKNYELDLGRLNTNPLNYEKATADPEGTYLIDYKSSNMDVAFPVNPQNPDEHDYYGEKLRVKKSGTAQIVATIRETDEYDKAQDVFTLRIYNSGESKGTPNNPFTVEEAIQLAKGENYEPGRCYFIKGIVNKVNSGMLSMFGDMGLDEIMGDDMDMEERMGDMDDFDMSEMGDMMGGMDLASIIPGFGSSEGVDYYISDDGTKDNRIKVVKGMGRGLYSAAAVGSLTGPSPTAIKSFAKLDDLSPGDEVLIFGPLVVSEDNNMFAGLMGNNGNGQNNQNDEEAEDKKTVKVDELNYLFDQKMMLLVKDQHLYNSDNYTKHIPEDNDFFFTLNGTPNGAVQPAQVKSADEEIAKWVIENEDNEQLKDSLFTPLNPGNTKVTTKVKVVVHEKDPNDEDSKEKYYTMKRKFNLEVRPIDKDPEGRNVGEYVLVKNVNEFDDEEATRRLLIVGTRVKEGETNEEGTAEDEITNYILGTEDAMMGGGKGAKKIDNEKITINDDGRECIKYEDVPEKSQEIILEEKEGTDYWYLKVGKDENKEPLYLYASDYKEENNESSEGQEGQEGQGGQQGQGTGGFNMDEMMEMFSPSSGLKIGTLEGTSDGQTTGEAVDSCTATIAISSGDIAIISYPKTEGKKNTVVLTSSFDLEGIMNMFGGNEEEEGDGEQQSEQQSSTGMNFDFFMGAFNSVKADDEKGMKPRIFMFKQYDQYPITIGEAEWMTFVSDYDVEAPADVEAYVVTKIVPGATQCKASLKLEGSLLKGGVPYLLHAQPGTYTMTRYRSEQPLAGPKKNLLLISTDETRGDKTTGSSVYVLGKKSNGVGFYRWTGLSLGAGRVYLSHEPEPDIPAALREFISFGDDTPTDISSTPMDEQETTVSYYNLSGQRVDKPLMKGVYITNGKKILVK